MKTHRRRLLLMTAAAAVFPGLARAEPLTYRGFRIDMDAVPVSSRVHLETSLIAQIDLIESLSIDGDISRWFRTVPVTIDPGLSQAGRYRNGRVALRDRVVPSDNPVLLHELLHAFMDQRLARDGQLNAYYDSALSSGVWPAGSYMLSNLAEFFAMTGSVALWGRAARPPATRAALQAAMPDYVAWLDRLFGRTG